MNSSTGRSTTQTLDWCQSQFMSEPYPGVANHIGNILSTHYTRVGIGIAIQGGEGDHRVGLHRLIGRSGAPDGRCYTP